MIRPVLSLGLLILFAAIALPNPAYAQGLPTRTWVSGVGDDVNTCSRTSPCKTFAGAIAKTAAGGEINCLDPGGFGGLEIVRAITIDCTGTFGSVLFSGAFAAISVSVGANDKVTLRGLSLSGGPSGGLTGIKYASGGELHIENVTIENFVHAGISVEKNSLGYLTVRNSTFQRGPIGVRVASQFPALVASIDGSRFNVLSVSGVVASNNAYVAVSNSVFSGIGNSAINASASSSTVYASDNMFSNNNIALYASTAGATIKATRNKMFGNSRAFFREAGGNMITAGDNTFDINPGNGATGNLVNQ